MAKQEASQTLKAVFGSVFRLAINLVILYLLIKLFLFAYGFAYQVFANEAFSPNVQASSPDSNATLTDAVPVPYLFTRCPKVSGLKYPSSFSVNKSPNLSFVLDVDCSNKALAFINATRHFIIWVLPVPLRPIKTFIPLLKVKVLSPKQVKLFKYKFLIMIVAKLISARYYTQK